MKKQDNIHKPATFDPAAYEYIGMIYTGPRGGETGIPIISPYEIEQRRQIAANPYAGNFKEKGTCDHCGAYFHYGAIFQHSNGDMIVVGHICADVAFGHDSRRRYDNARIRREIAGYRKRGRIANQAADFLQRHPGLEEALQCNALISRDLLGKLMTYGSLSDKQVALAMRIPDQVREEREQVLKRESAPDWQGGRQDVTATIVTTKWRENDYGDCLKMLIRLDDGRKAWGSVPNLLTSVPDEREPGYNRPRTIEEYKGLRIAFSATVEPSRDDLKFAYFKRPSKTRILSERS